MENRINAPEEIGAVPRVGGAPVLGIIRSPGPNRIDVRLKRQHLSVEFFYPISARGRERMERAAQAGEIRNAVAYSIRHLLREAHVALRLLRDAHVALSRPLAEGDVLAQPRQPLAM